MGLRWIALGPALGILAALASCSSSGSGGSSGTGGASSGGTGGVGCNCRLGAYMPACGVDGKTYDATCGTQCVPVAIACMGDCPCADAGSGGTSSGGSGGTSSGGSGGTTSGGGTTGGAAGASGGAAGGSGFDPGDQVCLTKGTRGPCISCCANNHAAWQTVAQATRDCECTSPGLCKSVCAADYCQSSPGGTSCYDCIFPTLASGQPCYTAAKQVCGSDTDCNYYVECRAKCVSTLP